MTLTIQNVNKIGETEIEVIYQLSDGSIRNMRFNIDVDKPTIRQSLKDELNRLDSIDGKVSTLKTLEGVVIN